MTLILGEIKEGNTIDRMVSRFETLDEWKEKMEKLGELTPEPGLLEHPEALFFRFKPKGHPEHFISVEFGEETETCRDCGAKKRVYFPCANCAAMTA